MRPLGHAVIVSDLPGSADSAFLEALLSEAPIGFALYDTQRRFLRVNAVLARLNGLPVPAHLGRRPTEILAPAVGEAIEDMLTHVLERGESIIDTVFTGEITGTGGVRHWQSSWFPVRNGEATHGVAVLVTDVTAHHRAQEALRRSQEQAARLQQVTAELAAALTVRQVARVVGAAGRKVLDASAVDLVLLDGRDRLAVVVSDLRRRTTWAPVDAGTDHIAKVVMRDRRPLLLPTGRDLLDLLPAEPVRRFAEATAERSWAVIPLLAGRHVLGVLRVAFPTERYLEPDERIFLDGVAGQSALAVERARLYEREHRIAVALQRSLLPERIPKIPGVDVTTRYLPAVDADVGGDWYDAFALPSGRVVVVVGDVMGKGVAAAAGMGRVRSALRALAFTDPDPVAVLGGLDRVFSATEGDEHLTTLVYALIDPETGDTLVGEAGHLPVVLVPHDGPPSLLDGGVRATPLGMPEPRTRRTVTLRPGDALVAYTDGLVESRRSDVGDGLSRLLAAAAAGPTDQLDTLLDRLVEALVPRHDRDDDVTVLGLRLSRAQSAPLTR